MMKTAMMCAGALTVAATSHADFVDVQYVGFGVGETITVTSTVFNGSLEANQIFMSLTNSTAGPDYPNLNGNWIVFCAELPQTVNDNVTPYQTAPIANIPLTAPMGVLREAAINDLYWFAAGAQYGNDGAYAAAFQVAIWEVIMDYNGGPASIADTLVGDFQVSGLSVAAQAYLAALLGSIGSGQSAPLVGLTNQSYQDFIIELPAPGALALLGMAGVVGTRRRRA